MEKLSVNKRKWKLSDVDEHICAALRREYGLPEIVCKILLSRGVSRETVEDFLNPTLRNLLPDPSHLLDMDVAAERIAIAIMNREKIAIFGDYDVDGATSSAILARYFRNAGIEPVIYIPDRMKEGYGPNTPALLGLKAQGVSLVITVDCGTLAFEPLAAAKNAGLDVVVVDHHIGEARRVEALAIINPNRLDEASPHTQLAAVGVAFLLLVALNRELRKSNFFAERKIKEPDLRQWLDIVALGTVCDVVPLTGVNRALVAQGLKIMAVRGNLGISTILDTSRVDESPSCYVCGFVVGPRINAGGRVGRSDLGVRLLTSEDEQEAKQIAGELEQYNAERKAIEALVLEEAMAQAEKADADLPLLVLAGQGWHAGVIGIVAGRVKERFQKPVAVIGLVNGIGKASARSVSGVDFGAAVIAARDRGLLIAGGGHAMAAGFTVAEEKIPALNEFLLKRISAYADKISERSLHLDGILSIGGATPELLLHLEKLAPFGQANREPRFMIQQVVNLRSEIIKDSHVKCIFIDRLSSARLSAISFRAIGTELGDALLSSQGKTLDVAGTIRLNEWNGRQSVNMILEDVMLV